MAAGITSIRFRIGKVLRGLVYGDMAAEQDKMQFVVPFRFTAGEGAEYYVHPEPWGLDFHVSPGADYWVALVRDRLYRTEFRVRKNDILIEDEAPQPQLLDGKAADAVRLPACPCPVELAVTSESTTVLFSDAASGARWEIRGSEVIRLQLSAGQWIDVTWEGERVALAVSG